MVSVVYHVLCVQGPKMNIPLALAHQGALGARQPAPPHWPRWPRPLNPANEAMFMSL
ncbi:hypothetical protein BCR44DRAFT_1449556, partial [Catenaria anguillulae PL171]